MVLPHLGTGTFSPGGVRRSSTTGFADRASLGDIGRIKLDRTPVMDVALEGPAVGEIDLRWRGAALERFDGRTWSREPGEMLARRPDREGRIRELFGPSAPGPERTDLVQHVRLQSSDAGVLFAAGLPQELVSRDLDFVVTDDAGDLRTRTDRGVSLRYTVTSRLPPADRAALRRASGEDPPDVRRRGLALPPLDARAGQLARRLTAGAPTRYDAVQAIEAWLTTERTYTLDMRDERLEDPLAAFLFDGMAGHCEYFATAMVVLARSAGIPSRLVTGYLRGQESRFSAHYLVRQSDAHAWVEVYFPTAGWVTFDPTPPAGRATDPSNGVVDLAADLHAALSRWWDDHLIGLDLDDQYQRLLSARETLSALGVWIQPALVVVVSLAAAVALASLVLVRRRIGAPAATTSDRRVAVPAFYRQLLSRLARRGWTRLPHETPAELARRVAGRLAPAQAQRVHELTALYYRVRFDPRTSERDVRGLARTLLAELES
jgi:transglutaminase-like putative cysteine protease